MALDGVILSMQRLINEAQEKLREYEKERLHSYFSAEGEPLTEQFKMTGGRILEVPRYSLAPQSCLAIDEVELCFDVAASAKEAAKFREAAGVKEPWFKALWERLRGARKQEMITVKVLFKAGEPEKQGV
jgi:hypothetical protein